MPTWSRLFCLNEDLLELVAPMSVDLVLSGHLTSVRGEPREDVAMGYYIRPDRADNILERVEEQVEWLRDIGFDHADCYFKSLELAVFGGTRPHGQVIAVHGVVP